MNGDSHILGALAVLDVAEDERVAAGHGGVESEDALLRLPLAEDDLVLRVHDEEVNQLVVGGALANEESATDVLRGLLLDVLIERLTNSPWLAWYARYLQSPFWGQGR